MTIILFNLWLVKDYYFIFIFQYGKSHGGVTVQNTNSLLLVLQEFRLEIIRNKFNHVNNNNGFCGLVAFNVKVAIRKCGMYDVKSGHEYNFKAF